MNDRMSGALLMVFIVSFAVILLVSLYFKYDTCKAAGGIIVSTLFGWECIGVEHIK